MVDYTKPWLSIDQQIAQFPDRGLLIADVTGASNLLEEVGYTLGAESAFAHFCNVFPLVHGPTRPK